MCLQVQQHAQLGRAPQQLQGLVLPIVGEAEVPVIAGEDPGEGVVAQAAVTARTLAGQLARGHAHLIGTAALHIHHPGVQAGMEGGGSQCVGPMVKALRAICTGLGLLGAEGQGPSVI